MCVAPKGVITPLPPSCHAHGSSDGRPGHPKRPLGHQTVAGWLLLRPPVSQPHQCIPKYILLLTATGVTSLDRIYDHTTV